MDTLIAVDVFQFGNYRLDRRAGGLFRRDENGSFVPVAIGSRALDVISVLIERHGELVSKDEIMRAVWPDTVVEEGNLTVQISALRRVLDDPGADASCIQTVAGRGYRFVAPVTRIAAGSPASATAKAAAVVDIPNAAVEGSALMRRRFPRPAAALLVLIGIVAVGWVGMLLGEHGWLRTDQARPPLSIIVLPFANLNSDPEQDYFAEAITDDLTTDLSAISGSVVIAHSTAQSYRGKPVNVRQIGRDLDVAYALEGSVRRMGDQVEVNAQLIETDNGTHVWADRFQTDRRNLAAAQSDITGRLARTLHLELVEAAGRRIELEKTVDPDASDLAMRGWVLWFRPLSAATHEAAAHAFDRALEIDPGSVDAKIGVATILVSNVGTGMSQSPQQDRARAERLLLEAIEQDPNSSRAYEALGTLRRIQTRLDESRIELERAVALDRNNAHALLQLGETLMFMGRPADGIPPIEASIRLNPSDPNAAFGDWALGTCHLLLGHMDQAVDLLRKARAENPRVYFFQLYLAGALGLRGDVDEARAVLADAIRLKPQANSLARWTALQPWIGNLGFMALRDKTVDVGLRRAGMPDN